MYPRPPRNGSAWPHIGPTFYREHILQEHILRNTLYRENTFYREHILQRAHSIESAFIKHQLLAHTRCILLQLDHPHATYMYVPLKHTLYILKNLRNAGKYALTFIIKDYPHATYMYIKQVYSSRSSILRHYIESYKDNTHTTYTPYRYIYIYI